MTEVATTVTAEFQGHDTEVEIDWLFNTGAQTNLYSCFQPFHWPRNLAPGLISDMSSMNVFSKVLNLNFTLATVESEVERKSLLNKTFIFKFGFNIVSGRLFFYFIFVKY